MQRNEKYFDSRYLWNDDYKRLALKLDYKLKLNLYKLAFMDQNLSYDNNYYAGKYFGTYSDFQKLNTPALCFILKCYYIDVLIASIPEGEKKLAELASTKYEAFSKNYNKENKNKPFIYTPLDHVITELKKCVETEKLLLTSPNSNSLLLDYPHAGSIESKPKETQSSMALVSQPPTMGLLLFNSVDREITSVKISAADQEAFFCTLLNVFQSGNFRPEYSLYILSFKNKLQEAGKPYFNFGTNKYKTAILLLDELFSEFNPNLLTDTHVDKSFKSWQRQIVWDAKRFILESSVYQNEILEWLMELGEHAGKSFEEYDEVRSELRSRLNDLLEKAENLMDLLFRSKTYYLTISKAEFISEFNLRYDGHFLNRAETFIQTHLGDFQQFGDYIRYLRNLVLFKLFPDSMPTQYTINFLVLDVDKIAEYQKILGVNPVELTSYQGLFSAINKAYRIKSITCHPDKHPEKTKDFLELTNAKDSLLQHYAALQTQGIPFKPKIEENVTQKEHNNFDKEINAMIEQIDQMVGKVKSDAELGAINALRLRMKEKEDKTDALLELNNFKSLYFAAQTLMTVTYSGTDEKFQTYPHHIKLAVKEAYFKYQFDSAENCKSCMLGTISSLINLNNKSQTPQGLKLFANNIEEKKFLHQLDEAMAKISAYDKKQEKQPINAFDPSLPSTSIFK